MTPHNHEEINLTLSLWWISLELKFFEYCKYKKLNVILLCNVYDNFYGLDLTSNIHEFPWKINKIGCSIFWCLDKITTATKNDNKKPGNLYLQVFNVHTLKNLLLLQSHSKVC